MQNHPKGVNYFSSPHSDEPYVIGKLSIREARMCSFSVIGHKINKIRLWKVLAQELGNFSVEWKSCASRGIDNFSSAHLHEPYAIGRSRLAELKYSTSAGEDVRLKNYGTQVFRSTRVKHGLLEGTTFFLDTAAQAVCHWKALD